MITETVNCDQCSTKQTVGNPSETAWKVGWIRIVQSGNGLMDQVMLYRTIRDFCTMKCLADFYARQAARSD